MRGNHLQRLEAWSGEYDPVRNNCEHFVSYFMTGVRKCYSIGRNVRHLVGFTEKLSQSVMGMRERKS